MINIAVCDDEKNELKRISAFIEAYLEAHPEEEFNVKTFSNPMDLVEFVNKKGSFDIYFLDVIMGAIKGTDVAKEIRQKENDSEIIFITASREYAIDAFALNATHYIVKPCISTKFFEALERALSKLREKGDKFLVRKTSSGVQRINLRNFVYSESSGHYQFVHLSNGTEVKIRSKTSELWEELQQYKNFLRSHSGYIVNMDYIKNISSYGVSLENVELPISKNTYNNIKKIYLDYTFNNKG